MRRRLFGMAIGLVTLELAAQVLFAVKPKPPITDLQPYQMQDPARRWHQLLRPAFVETYAEAAAFKKQTSRLLGEAYLTELRADPSEMFVRINRAGFRGPE